MHATIESYSVAPYASSEEEPVPESERSRRGGGASRSCASRSLSARRCASCSLSCRSCWAIMAALAGLGATSGGAAAGDAGAGAWAHCHLLASSLPAAPGSQNVRPRQAQGGGRGPLRGRRHELRRGRRLRGPGRARRPRRTGALRSGRRRRGDVRPAKPSACAFPTTRRTNFCRSW